MLNVRHSEKSCLNENLLKKFPEITQKQKQKKQLKMSLKEGILSILCIWHMGKQTFSGTSDRFLIEDKYKWLDNRFVS